MSSDRHVVAVGDLRFPLHENNFSVGFVYLGSFFSHNQPHSKFELAMLIRIWFCLLCRNLSGYGLSGQFPNFSQMIYLEAM